MKWDFRGIRTYLYFQLVQGDGNLDTYLFSMKTPSGGFRCGHPPEEKCLVGKLDYTHRRGNERLGEGLYPRTE